jgi:hypothetical protein
VVNDLLPQQILAALERRELRAAFVAEVATAIRPAPSPGDLDGALGELRELRKVVVVDHAPPDIHLASSDLRIVASLPSDGSENAALEAADQHWNDWLRMFLSTHRCQ